MYCLARRGSILGSQCKTRWMLKHLCSLSYRVSGIIHVPFGSWWVCLLFCLCMGCAFIGVLLYALDFCLSISPAMVLGRGAFSLLGF